MASTQTQVWLSDVDIWRFYFFPPGSLTVSCPRLGVPTKRPRREFLNSILGSPLYDEKFHWSYIGNLVGLRSQRNRWSVPSNLWSPIVWRGSSKSFRSDIRDMTKSCLLRFDFGPSGFVWFYFLMYPAVSRLSSSVSNASTFFRPDHFSRFMARYFNTMILYAWIVWITWG